MVTATITSKGQVTIPKGVRDSLRLHSGDLIEFIVHNQSEATLKHLTKSVDEVFGRLHRHGRPARSVDEMNSAVARRITDKTR